MRQRLVELRDELAEALRSLVADVIPSEVQLADHFTVLEELAQLFDMLIT